MKITKFIVVALSVLTLMGMNSFNQAQAQTVEFSYVSLWIPDRYKRTMDFSSCKKFHCDKAGSDENDSEINMDIDYTSDSVEELIDYQSRHQFTISTIGQQCFVGKDGSARGYFVYKESSFGHDTMKGIVYADLGYREKLSIKFSMPLNQNTVDDFNQMLDSISVQLRDYNARREATPDHIHADRHIHMPW